MEFVGSNEVFGDLSDVSVFRCRQELGTDGRGDDVEERVTHVFVLNDVVGSPGDEVFDQGFGHGGIDAIHAHVVAVERCPAECKFAEVSCSDHEASHLSRGVHENLGALSSL